VGAAQYDEGLAPYSNYGPCLDLVTRGNTGLDENGDGYDDIHHEYEQEYPNLRLSLGFLSQQVRSR